MTDSIIILDKSQILEDFEKKKSLLKTILTNIKTYCRQQIGKDYATESFRDRADKVYVLTDSHSKIIGFASIIITNNSKENFYYIDLICSAEYHKMKTRESADKVSGKDLMNKIFSDALKDGAKYIKLKAIESVIPYYNKLYDFNFKNKVYEKEDKLREDAIIKELYIKQFQAKELDDYSIVEEFLKGHREFIKAIEGYYTEADLRMRPREKDFASKTENGFTMYKQLLEPIPEAKRKTKRKIRTKKIRTKKIRTKKNRTKKIRTKKSRTKKIRTKKNGTKRKNNK